jgi:8-oxo-dGTP diphosphatase
MIYVAFDTVEGEASVVDEEELDSLEWVMRHELVDYVPYGLFEPVQTYLDTALFD